MYAVRQVFHEARAWDPIFHDNLRFVNFVGLQIAPLPFLDSSNAKQREKTCKALFNQCEKEVRKPELKP